MSLMQDLINFVDGGSRVKFYADGSTYYPKPHNVIEYFEHGFKQYYKTAHACFVGVGISEFVRKIAVKDYNDMKNIHLEHVGKSCDKSKRSQLGFDF